MSESDTLLDDLRVMLGLNGDDQDQLLNLIIKTTRQNLGFRLGVTEVPEELSFIALEVCVRRFNRVKNEGMASYTQEGESISFLASDFDDFDGIINEWRRRHDKDVKSLGKVTFVNAYGGKTNANESPS
ncbi:phage head-tail connector protein [Limosilactobacillus fermentum]